MNMRKLGALLVLGAMALGMLAGVANAADVIVAQGAPAVVGKVSYDANCTTDPTGGGIGLPVVNGTKSAYYRFNGPITALNAGAGTLTACGDLSDVAGIGAACGMSKGSNGFGSADFSGTSNDATLSNLAWEASTASVFVVTGTATPGGAVKAVVSARGTGTQCAEKDSGASPKTGGAGNFVVDIVATIGA